MQGQGRDKLGWEGGDSEGHSVADGPGEIGVHSPVRGEHHSTVDTERVGILGIILGDTILGILGILRILGE